MSDLRKKVKPPVKYKGTSEAAPTPRKFPPVWPQYIVLVLGILIQPFFALYQKTGDWNFAGFLGRILFAVIAAVIILPSVYKNAFDPEKPLVIQLSTLFVAGMGWESLLTTAIAAVTK